MAVIVEAYHIQFKDSFLHREKMFPYKIALLIIVALSFLYINIYVYILLALIGIIHFLLIREYRIILYSLLIYIPPALLIVLVDYLAGTLSYRIVATLFFGYTSFIYILLFYATTPIQQLYKYLGRNVFTLSLLMLHNTVSELYEVIKSKKARGWEPGFNIYNHFLLVFEAIRITIMRIEEITTALRSRGID
ncbi:hypothetical protein [Staphylothermus hellenicus]|uniref:Cobalt transport protein n=1 Tax=Staphylothermus hellenicus (strain DSM 12710 / JCM 10830 / BK20S6-10-b1 / P8) TaxID=591019 RepID=D7DBJ4_STAHD|nr:hypothetical protein [Staphylothermus hellenicus]ADI31541.1 cobalt transport protein [Staphylothermus hellenicus DSM 12710]